MVSSAHSVMLAGIAAAPFTMKYALSFNASACVSSNGVEDELGVFAVLVGATDETTESLKFRQFGLVVYDSWRRLATVAVLLIVFGLLRVDLFFAVVRFTLALTVARAILYLSCHFPSRVLGAVVR